MKKSWIPTQPLSGSTFQDYFSLLRTNKFDIAPKYLSRVLYTSLVSALATTPLSKFEKALRQKSIEEHSIAQAPVFIIGHWRSGTTFLHYLMSKDTNFGYLSNAQAFCPGYMFYHLPKLIKKIIGLHLPCKRPMDDIKITLDNPQEEEFALVNMSGQSCYHWWTFPKKMKEYFEKYVLLKNLTAQEYQQFKQTYLSLMKKTSLVNTSKRLLIKNPVNTGRIPLLLELFPNAQFIYLHREPLEVYHSTLKLHTKLLECFSFQHFDRKEIEQNTITFHQKLLQKYEQDKLLIPSINLVEIDFKSLTTAPLEISKHIYNSLNIPDFENAFNAFKYFVDTQKNYQKDTYITNPVLEKALLNTIMQYKNELKTAI